jgi:hypothetical protein
MHLRLPLNEHQDEAALLIQIWSGDGSGSPVILKTTVKDSMECFNINIHGHDECAIILALVKMLPGRFNAWEQHNAGVLWQVESTLGHQ